VTFLHGPAGVDRIGPYTRSRHVRAAELWITPAEATTSPCTRAAVTTRSAEVRGEARVQWQADPHRRREASRSGSGAAAHLGGARARCKTPVSGRCHHADQAASTHKTQPVTSASSMTSSCADWVAANSGFGRGAASRPRSSIHRRKRPLEPRTRRPLHSRAHRRGREVSGVSNSSWDWS